MTNLRAVFIPLPRIPFNLPLTVDVRGHQPQNARRVSHHPQHRTTRTAMERGISEKSKLLRRQLLNHNAPDMMRGMQKSGMADPVGMVVEMTDDIGKQLTYAALEKQGMPRHEIPELNASYCKNAIPTFTCVVSFDTATKILPITSESALRNLIAPRKACVHWIVVVGGGGSSYAGAFGEAVKGSFAAHVFRSSSCPPSTRGSSDSSGQDS